LIDQYGMIVQSRNGIERSQANTIAGTSARSEASQLAAPYVM
jgi:hypothetical protein